MRSLIVIDARDNVAVALRDLKVGETASADGVEIKARQAIARNHKVAVRGSTESLIWPCRLEGSRGDIGLVEARRLI